MTATLLDENHEVMQEFKPDPVTLDPDCDDCSWKQVRSPRASCPCPLQRHTEAFSDLPLERKPMLFSLSLLEIQVSHTFTEYGPGMRFIAFEHGGQDTKFWDGWFGVRVTGSSVTVEV